MEEIWKDIEGYEGRYQVSSLGNVKSLNHGGHGYSKNLCLKKNTNGYLQVELYKNGTKKMITVHRLVAQAFIPNPDDKRIINHKDENKHNNAVWNLEWCDTAYNNRYSWNRHPERWPENPGKRRKERTNRDHRDKMILQITKSGDVIREWRDIRELRLKTSYSQWSILQCCDGKRKTAHGFKWQFAI